MAFDFSFLDNTILNTFGEPVVFCPGQPEERTVTALVDTFPIHDEQTGTATQVITITLPMDAAYTPKSRWLYNNLSYYQAAPPEPDGNLVRIDLHRANA